KRLVELLGEGIVSAELGEDFGGGGAGQVSFFGGGGECSGARMAPSTVAFTDVRQVDHLLRLGFGPGIGTNRNLSAEAGLAQSNTVGRIGMQEVGNEFVVTLHRLISDVEVQGAVHQFGALADQGQRFVVALEQRRKQLGDKRLLQDVEQTHFREQRNQLWYEGRILT